MFLPLVVLAVLSACGRDAPRPEVPDVQAMTGEPVPTTATVPLGRLPRDVRPLHYRLELTVLPELPVFTGRAAIRLQLTTATRQFYLHGRGLNVSVAELELPNRLPLTVEYHQVDPSGVARIDLPEAVSGEVTLNIDYSAPFNRSLEALYTVEAGGRDYAFTQFEAISAREAFPGFDEPAFKTPYDISLVVHEAHTAVANTPAVETESLGGGLKRVRFATSQALPTYLVAVAVGPFDVVDAPDLPPTGVRDRPVPLRGLAVAGNGPRLQFALDNTRDILEALESYFGIPYPYAKLDLIAVPDFGAGAMENAATITYRDAILLVDPQARPQARQRFYSVHAHELAHQWFGDLVTPAWWDDIWLNESFATWMAYAALDLWRPDLEFRREITRGALGVMEADARVSARQIRQPVLSNHDIANAFDGITYRKGGAVLAMFESLLGRDAFRAGVQEYVRRHAGGNATADDFIDALVSQSPDRDPAQLAAAFRSFLEQPGLPLLSTAWSCQDGITQVSLSQSRYLPLGSSGDPQRDWLLPVCLNFGDAATESTHCQVLTRASESLRLDTPACPEWLMPNAGAAGYYRWTLDPAGWQALLASAERLRVEEMMSIADSLDGAFDAGRIDVATYLQVARRMVAHADWRIATSPMTQLAFLQDRVADPAQRQQLAAAFGALYTAALDRTGLSAPDHLERAEMQAAVTEFLAFRAKLPEWRDELRRMAWRLSGFQDQVAGEINDNLVALALAVAVQDDVPGAPFSRHLQARLLASDDAVFRSRALDALGFSNDPGYRAELLELTLSPDLRDNEFYRPLDRLMTEAGSREATWTWLRAHLPALLERTPEWSKGNVAAYGRHFCDAAHRTEVETFFTPRVQGLQGGPRILANTLETIDLCIAKAGHHRAGLASFLGD